MGRGQARWPTLHTHPTRTFNACIFAQGKFWRPLLCPSAWLSAAPAPRSGTREAPACLVGRAPLSSPSGRGCSPALYTPEVPTFGCARPPLSGQEGGGWREEGPACLCLSEPANFLFGVCGPSTMALWALCSARTPRLANSTCHRLLHFFRDHSFGG